MWASLSYISDFGGKAFIFFRVEHDVSCGVCHKWLFLVETCFLYTSFVKFFNHEECHIFIKWFFCICWSWGILFLLIYCVTLIDLWIFNYPCIPEVKSYLIMIYDPFYIVELHLLMFCWGFFASIFFRGNGLYFFLSDT